MRPARRLTDAVCASSVTNLTVAAGQGGGRMAGRCTESDCAMTGMHWLAYLEGRSRPFLWLAALVLTLVFGVIDYATGPEIAFGVFYLVPVALGAYLLGRGAGLALSLTSALTWLAADLADGLSLSHPLIHFWNAGTRLIFYAVMTVLLSALRRSYEQQRALARSDALTGVANGRAFFETAALELERARRFRRPLSLVHMDVDGFKGVNDRLGHPAGDALLITIAAALRSAVRRTDLVARLGGDEFVVLLPETASGDARVAAEKLRARLNERMTEGHWPVSFSIGLATFEQAPESVDALLVAADALTYQAKRAGKDRIQQSVVDPTGASGAPVGAH